MIERRSPIALRAHPEAERVPAMTGDEYRALVADVRRRGIVTPLDVTATGIVLDGRHRLRAAHELGLAEVPVSVVSPEDEKDYILASAIERRHLMPGQRAALAIERHDYRRACAEARERQEASRARPGEQVGANARVAVPAPTERPREVAARLAGVSPRTVEDVLAVRAADPELFDKVKAGKIAARRAAEHVRRRQRDSTLPGAPPLTASPFAVVYADPPWRSRNPDAPWAAERHYPTLTLDEIKALPVAVARDAACFLWAVNSMLPEALDVLSAWGFSYRTNLVWAKPSIGLGAWARNQHELLLLGIRGSMRTPAAADRPPSLIAAPRTAHSAKPEIAYQLIEQMYPGLSRVELYARQRRQGWVAWGNEAAA